MWFADAVAAAHTPELAAVGGSVSHGRLLPLCDAVLHAGGAGTTNAALLAGVPQLMCPLHFDQFSWVRACPQMVFLDSGWRQGQVKGLGDVCLSGCEPWFSFKALKRAFIAISYHGGKP